MPASHGPRSACWFLLGVGAALANLSLPGMAFATHSEYFGALVVGVAAAELGLLSIVAALGPGRSSFRIPATVAVAWLLLFIFYVGLVPGLQGTLSMHDVRQLGGMFLLLPCLLLAAQAPLWLLRAVTSVHLDLPGNHDPQSSPQLPRFGIGQLMFATALIAVSLALARGALTLWLTPPDTPGDQWMYVMRACAVLAGTSAMVTVPCTIVIFYVRRTIVSILAILVYFALAASCVLTIVGAVSGTNLPARSVAVLCTFSLSTFAGILGGLSIIRRFGFTITRY